METLPDSSERSAPVVIVESDYQDPVSKALWVHKDLVQVLAPWAEEAHIKPMAGMRHFGDVESFVAYVKRYGGAASLITWGASGLLAILDHGVDAEHPGRGAWMIDHPFAPTHQWRAWQRLANGNAISQKQAVEWLEDLVDDIIDPAPADLMSLLRNLRGSMNATANTELRPDGTSNVRFTKDNKVEGNGVDLPPIITIGIPILKGHVDEQGKAVFYRLAVRIRVSVDDGAHLTLRFTLPGAELVLEDVYADRVAAATKLLGPDLPPLLRAAD